VSRAAVREAYGQAGLVGALRVTLPSVADLVTTATAEQISVARQSPYSASRDFFVAGVMLLPMKNDGQ
jgi:hypothetical protein